MSYRHCINVATIARNEELADWYYAAKYRFHLDKITSSQHLIIAMVFDLCVQINKKKYWLTEIIDDLKCISVDDKAYIHFLKINVCYDRSKWSIFSGYATFSLASLVGNSSSRLCVISTVKIWNWLNTQLNSSYPNAQSLE